MSAVVESLGHRYESAPRTIDAEAPDEPGRTNDTLLVQDSSKPPTANGFANRFLWCYSARTRKLPEGGEDLTFIEEAAALRKVVEFARWRDEFKRSEEARAYWRSIYDELTDETTPGLWGKSTGRFGSETQTASRRTPDSIGRPLMNPPLHDRL
jgi:hypothetical protein